MCIAPSFNHSLWHFCPACPKSGGTFRFIKDFCYLTAHSLPHLKYQLVCLYLFIYLLWCVSAFAHLGILCVGSYVSECICGGFKKTWESGIIFCCVVFRNWTQTASFGIKHLSEMSSCWPSVLLFFPFLKEYYLFYVYEYFDYTYVYILCECLAPLIVRSGF